MQRRTFLRTAAAASAAMIWPRRASAAEAQVEISPNEPGATISPHIYGHFMEHIGGVIYDGFWVGPDSKIPNIGGIRKQIVDDLKRIEAPNLRWPGGCYADGHHWRDGIGPPAERPRTYNFWQKWLPDGIDVTETNAFGTREFLHLCKLVDAEPYIAANLGTGTPREFRDWVLYCNAPQGTVSQAAERAANGDPEPFNVRYWGVGNESWGCGGHFSAAEYAAEYGRFVTQYPNGYNTPYFIAAGPNSSRPDGHLNRTREFFEAMEEKMSWPAIDGWAVHFYTSFAQTDSHATEITPETWYRVLHRGIQVEGNIEEHWKILGEYDKDHRIKLLIDEWGAWHKSGTEPNPQHLFGQIGSLRDAVHCAMSFDIFNRHADKIDMCNLAQTVNNLHSLFTADGDRFYRTPTYYVFELYRPHMGASLVPASVEAPAARFSRGGHSFKRVGAVEELPGLSASASVKGKQVTLTLVNPSIDHGLTTRVVLKGARPQEAQGRVLTHEDLRAANTFDDPDKVKPASLGVTVDGSAVIVDLPKQAVAAVEIRMV